MFLLAVIYFVLMITFGVLTWRRRHRALFWFGIIFPVLWLIGAVLPPPPRAAH